MGQVQAVAKALISALTIFIASLLQVADNGLTLKEWLGALLATLTSGALVYFVPNKPAVPDGQAGQGIVGLVCTILGIIMIIIGGFNLIAAALANVTPNWLLDIVLIVVGLILVGTRFYDFDGSRRRSL